MAIYSVPLYGRSRSRPVSSGNRESVTTIMQGGGGAENGKSDSHGILQVKYSAEPKDIWPGKMNVKSLWTTKRYKVGQELLAD